MKRSNHNKLKFEDILLKEINVLLRKEFNDPAFLMCSITHVSLNNDYSSLRVYWDTFDPDNKEKISAAFKKITKPIRTVLAKNLDFRSIPTISFKYNSQFEDEHKIMNLIKKDE